VDSSRHDVIVVGSGPAGCATALLYAERGLRVALLERRGDPDAYKPVCTHFIQGVATPILRQLGMLDAMQAAGAVRNDINIWTRYGWIRPGRRADATHHGYNIRRETFDPILRHRALDDARIEFYQGWTVEAPLGEDGRVVGVRARNAEQGRTMRLLAPLSVGADGRPSVIGRAVQTRLSRCDNHRTFFVSYYRDLALATGRTSQLWFWKRDIAYAFPCDQGHTLLCIAMHRDDVADVEQDLDRRFHDYFKQLPDAPAMDAATRVARVTRGKGMHTIRRHHRSQGVALVGDALFAIDPYAGTGIAWGLCSAAWLVEQTAGPIARRESPATIAAAVRRYERLHARRLRVHAWMISSYSSGRDFRRLLPPERPLFAAAVHCQDVADTLDLFLNRVIGLRQLLAPRMVAAIVGHLLHRHLSGRHREVRRMGTPHD